MNLSKYRNRHIDYQILDFIRLNFKTDDISQLSSPKLKEVNLYNPNQSHIDKLPTLLNNNIDAKTYGEEIIRIVIHTKCL